MLNYALAYAARGWEVFPCRARGKTPLTKHGVKDATSDENVIRSWWTKYPDANIGLATGTRSGVDVLDVDPRHGGEDALYQLVKPADLPATVTVATGGGGHHYYFSENGTKYRNAANMLPGLDWRGNGGYVICPPSVHESGGEYVFEIDPSEGEIEDIPEWIRPYLKEATGNTSAVLSHDTSVGDEIPEGSRDDTLTKIAGSLRRYGASAATIYAALVSENEKCVPPLPEEDLKRIAESVSRYQPITSFNLTDTGNAERLMAKYGEDLRYCPPWRKWLRWDGSRWKIDDRNEIVSMATEVVRDIYAEAAMTEDKSERKRLAGWARTSESMSKLRAMIERAQSMAPVMPDELDQDKWLLNVRNGTVDLRNGTFREADRRDLITKQAPIDYDPDAFCPNFEWFLLQIFQDDTALVDFMQKALGYSMTGDTSEQCLFIAFGTGSNGKSTLLNTVYRLLGDYALSTPTEALMTQKTQGIPNDIARLKGVRYTTAMEVEEGRRLAEPLIKSMTGGDTITARFLFGEFFDFEPSHAIWISTNHKPRIRGTDHAIWRRLRMIPFTVQIPDEKQDKQLPAKLWEERSGILNWLIAGVQHWLSNGLPMPDAVKAATKEYRSEMDLLAEFCDLHLDDEHGAKTMSSEIYNAYKIWAEGSGERVMSQRALSLKLEERGYVRQKGRTANYWLDIRLRPED